MSTTVVVPLLQSKFGLAQGVVFPKKCIYCGQPQAATVEKTISRKEVARSSTRGSTLTTTTTFATTLKLPYCQRHAQAQRIHQIIGGVVAGLCLAGAAPLFLALAPLQVLSNTIVWIGTALVIAGVVATVAMFLVLAAAKNLLPRLAPSLESFRGYSFFNTALGVNALLMTTDIKFTFANEALAQEFERLNGQRQGR